MKNLSDNNIAIFGMGCFWAPDFYFSKLEGVINVEVGYSGGYKKNPTYTDLGDHTETLKIQFDPKIISYKKLLHHFLKEHDPTYKNKTQYRSVIFYLNDDQKKIAHKTLQDYDGNKIGRVETDLEKAGQFYRAEEYHQKYYEKNNVRGVC